MSDQEVGYIAEKARQIRRHIIMMLEKAGSGHSAGALGMSDIFAVLYFSILRHKPQHPDWDERDMMVVSNGHIAPVIYASLAESGYIATDELATLRRLGSRLQGHPERTVLPGIETTSGPLGCGLSQAAGMAYVLQYLQANPHRFVYVTMGDGELDEGNIWEAAMFAGKYKLSQLVAIVDRNNIQIDGSTEEVMPLEDLRGKWESFGWHVQEIDGHDIRSIVIAASMARAVTNRPSVIIARTIPGKGVDFMEYDYTWHGKSPNHEQAHKALSQLPSKSRIQIEVTS